MTTEEMCRVNTNKLSLHGCFTVDCEKSLRSRRGGVCMLWRESCDLHITSFSRNHIMCTIKDEISGREWMCAGLYGWPKITQRHQTWKLMEMLHRSITNPWVCMGDFNEIMWNREKRGGNMRSIINMEMFEIHVQSVS